jgi:hypothetical protein
MLQGNYCTTVVQYGSPHTSRGCSPGLLGKQAPGQKARNEKQSVSPEPR